MADLSSVVESGEAERIASNMVFTEGPLWHPDGYLLFVDIRRSLIFKLVPGGEPEVFRDNSGGSNGLTFDLQGWLLMCEMDTRRLTRMESDGSVSVVLDRLDGRRINRPNDVVTRSDGSIYFTNPGLQRLEEPERELETNSVIRIAPDGAIAAVIPDFEYPNGLAFSPDESVLYVANTREPKFIMAYDVQSDGSVTNGRMFADMSSDEPDGVPDGMKVDVEGRVYCTGPGGCWVFDANGNHLGIIRLPEIPANCAWGEGDNQTMFFTARTSVYRMRMKTPGTKIPTV
jgi:gluconolactonase